mmetsp:Transcript_52533/g.151410  ORF Transcript_52533/g.151410 Transcript_52533/m.151410 type:complete len:105 (-) Transcript_52533:202-516(-)
MGAVLVSPGDCCASQRGAPDECSAKEAECIVLPMLTEGSALVPSDTHRSDILEGDFRSRSRGKVIFGSTRTLLGSSPISEFEELSIVDDKDVRHHFPRGAALPI